MKIPFNLNSGRGAVAAGRGVYLALIMGVLAVATQANAANRYECGRDGQEQPYTDYERNPKDKSFLVENGRLVRKQGTRKIPPQNLLINLQSRSLTGTYIHVDNSTQNLQLQSTGTGFSGNLDGTTHEYLGFGKRERAPRAGIDYRSGDGTVVPSDVIIVSAEFYLSRDRFKGQPVPSLHLFTAHAHIDSLPCQAK